MTCHDDYRIGVPSCRRIGLPGLHTAKEHVDRRDIIVVVDEHVNVIDKQDATTKCLEIVGSLFVHPRLKICSINHDHLLLHNTFLEEILLNDVGNKVFTSAATTFQEDVHIRTLPMTAVAFKHQVILGQLTNDLDSFILTDDTLQYLIGQVRELLTATTAVECIVAIIRITFIALNHFLPLPF